MEKEAAPPPTGAGSVVSTLQEEVESTKKGGSLAGSTDDQLFEKIETHLLEKIQANDNTAPFLLGQFYYEEGYPEKAVERFEIIKDQDWQAMYQLGTMYYDGIGCQQDQKKGVGYMLKVANSKSVYAAHLVHSAQYNLGRAYFEGYGVQQSNVEAERWWLLAADDGNPKASVIAQTMLGMLYSRPDFLDYKKSFFWHSEACGNGSVESQGILGVMYMEGKGIAKSKQSAYECLKEASERGNIYAQGRLVQLFYQNKLYTKACDLARRVVTYTNVEELAKETGCMASYIQKGIAIACYYLSRCLLLGNGLRKDVEEGNKYFKRVLELDKVYAHDCLMSISYGLD